MPFDSLAYQSVFSDKIILRKRDEVSSDGSIFPKGGWCCGSRIETSNHLSGSFFAKEKKEEEGKRNFPSFVVSHFLLPHPVSCWLKLSGAGSKRPAVEALVLGFTQ